MGTSSRTSSPDRTGRVMKEHPATAQPRGVSLVYQTAEAIRHLIAARHWTDLLPGEEEMRGHLEISRVTLRKALAQLAAQGSVVFGGRGRRHVITGKARSPAAARATSRVVKCLSQFTEIELVRGTRIVFDEIRKSLITRRGRLDWEQNASLWRGNPAERLRRLTADSGTAVWLLYRASPHIQRWFQENHHPCAVGLACALAARQFSASRCARPALRNRGLQRLHSL